MRVWLVAVVLALTACEVQYALDKRSEFDAAQDGDAERRDAHDLDAEATIPIDVGRAEVGEPSDCGEPSDAVGDCDPYDIGTEFDGELDSGDSLEDVLLTQDALDEETSGSDMGFDVGGDADAAREQEVADVALLDIEDAAPEGVEDADAEDTSSIDAESAEDSSDIRTDANDDALEFPDEPDIDFCEPIPALGFPPDEPEEALTCQALCAHVVACHTDWCHSMIGPGTVENTCLRACAEGRLPRWLGREDCDQVHEVSCSVLRLPRACGCNYCNEACHRALAQCAPEACDACGIGNGSLDQCLRACERETFFGHGLHRIDCPLVHPLLCRDVPAVNQNCPCPDPASCEMACAHVANQLSIFSWSAITTSFIQQICLEPCHNGEFQPADVLAMDYDDIGLFTCRLRGALRQQWSPCPCDYGWVPSCPPGTACHIRSGWCEE